MTELLQDDEYERRFAGAAKIYGEGSFQHYEQSHVMVIGIGGVGSWAAEALARTGIGELTLIDMDVVAASNINRQLPAMTATLGREKIEVMAERCREINPRIKLNLIDDYLTPENLKELLAGEVGFLCGSIKELGDARVGDTITHADRPATSPVPGFKEVKPMVFCGLYPTESEDYENLKAALEKLQLNDAAFSYEPETSQALGFGFRCGFLGLLHMEIIQERLEREFEVGLIATAPSVVYKVDTNDGKTLEIDNPSHLPDPTKIRALYEPYVTMDIHVPNDYVGNVMKLCEDKRGTQKNLHYLAANRVVVTYELPFAEIVYDFFDRLKSCTRGYASMDYEFKEYRPSDVVKVDILLNGEKVDALSIIVHRSQATFRGRAVVAKMREIISRQMFDVAIQAAIGGQIIARTTVKALRKNVLAKCYGGDVSRKKKLLEKQKAGKKRMKQVGSVEIPQEAFLAVLRVDN